MKKKYPENKKYVLSEKEAKNSYEGYPTEFTGSTQNLNNYRNTKSTNRNEKNSQKKKEFLVL
jgi:hypothetical protein